jgi:hypothetical protein
MDWAHSWRRHQTACSASLPAIHLILSNAEATMRAAGPAAAVSVHLTLPDPGATMRAGGTAAGSARAGQRGPRQQLVSGQSRGEERNLRGGSFEVESSLEKKSDLHHCRRRCRRRRGRGFGC